MSANYRVVKGTWQGVTWECFEKPKGLKTRELRGREAARKPAEPAALQPHPSAVFVAEPA